MGIAQNRLEQLAVSLAPPGATSDGVAMRWVEAGDAVGGTDLVEEDGLRADLLEDAVSEALDDTLPCALRGAHHRQVRRPRRVFLHIAGAIGPHTASGSAAR